MRYLFTLAVLLCAVVPALAAPTAPVNPIDWVGPMVVTNANYTAVSNDGRILAATDGTADITIIDLQQHRIISHCLPTIYDSASRVYSFFELNIPMMCLNDDGTILAFSHGRNITLWNCQTGKLITRLTLDTEAVSYVFVPGTTNLLIITADGILHTLDCKSFTWSKSHYIGGAVYSLVLLKDINRLAGYTKPNTMVLINPDDYSYRTYACDNRSYFYEYISYQGSWIGYDKRLNKIVALMPLDSLAYWKWPSMQLISKDDSEHNIGCISSKGTMVTEDHPGCPVICDINKKPILKLTEPDFSYGSCFSTSGNYAVMNFTNHTKIDLLNNKVMKSVFPDRGRILSPMTYVETSLHKGIAKYSLEVMPHIYSSGLPDSLTVFAGKYRLYQQNDGPLMLEVASTGKLLGKYPSIEERTSRCSISMSNDARLVSILSNNSISVRQVKSTEYLKLPDFRAEVFLGEMSPDGKLLAVGSFDHPAPPVDEFGKGATVFITAPGSKKVLCKLSPHQGYVISARFSKDSSRIVTIDEANTLRMWDSKSGHLLYTKPHAGMNVFYNSSNTKLIVWATGDAFDLLDAKTGKFLARTWRYQLGKYATISADGFYDGDKESCCSTEWSMDGGQMSTLAKSKLKHQSGLWEALAK